MILDCHVHTCAFTAVHGGTSAHLLKSLPFRFMRWRLGIPGDGAATEAALEDRLDQTIRQTPTLDAACVLAFDAVHDADGHLDTARTHLYVKNDYVIDLCRRRPKMLFACSVHPFRRDALAELERCIAAGAVLMKWLPVTQAFSPADPRCIPLYEALAHHNVPLLSHTGWEHALPVLDKTVADPALLTEAVRRGVTVIAAHCGTRAAPWEVDYVPTWARMAREHEHFYGDTSALNVPGRWYAYRTVLGDPVLRSKLVHGSDWPILPLPPVARVGWQAALHLMGDENWMRRDVSIKQQMDFDDAYWHRAGTLVRLPA